MDAVLWPPPPRLHNSKRAYIIRTGRGMCGIYPAHMLDEYEVDGVGRIKEVNSIGWLCGVEKG